MTDENKKISQNREKKEALVAEIANDVARAKALVFTNYQGLTHKQIEELKKSIKPMDADMIVAKNTLLKIALEKGNVKIDESASLEGPTGTMLLYGDVIEPLKRLAKSIKDLNLPTIKFAVIDGKMTSADDVIKLSSLPSREVLLTQMVVGLKSPIFGLHRAMSWNLQKLVMTLNAVASQKPAVAAPVSEPVAQAVETPVEPSVEVTESSTEEVSAPAEEAVTTEATVATEEVTQPEENKTDEQVSEGGEN